jgi:hypothetical protein
MQVAPVACGFLMPGASQQQSMGSKREAVLLSRGGLRQPLQRRSYRERDVGVVEATARAAAA